MVSEVHDSEHDSLDALGASHPATAKALTATTPHAAARVGRISAQRPTPICTTATTMKIRASWRCSAWMPAADA